MADSVIGTGTLPDGGNFQIYLDGISTYKQSERMISKLDALVKRFKATEQQDVKDKKEREEELDLLKDKNKKTKDFNKNLEDLNDSTFSLHEASYILRGDLIGLSQAGTNTSKGIIALGSALGGFQTIVTALTNYSGYLGQALQRGISGDVMTFAIASKTAGITMGQFNKALTESGGSFSALGGNATEGAKNFANLISQVRTATKSMGNFGLTNEEMANFVAQQTKFAVAQGFKGKRAEEVVLKNTVELGQGFQSLAERTGRTVKEMADAAAKLSMDPVVASFVKSAGAAGPEVSAAIAKLAGDFAGIFGEAGNKIAEDLTRSSLGNLPFVMTQSGKNMLLASNSVYTEMERQANMARNGIKTTEADQERLRQVVQQEVAMRGEELRTLANLPGPMGDAARQILQLAANAEQANTKEGREAKRRADNAKEFVGAVNDLQAKLQELAIPFLQLINGIDWTFMFSVLSGFAGALKFLLTPLEWLGSLLGTSGVGTVIGGFLAVAGVASMVVLGFTGLTKALAMATMSLKTFSQAAGKNSTVTSFVDKFRKKEPVSQNKMTTASDYLSSISSPNKASKQEVSDKLKSSIPFAGVAAGAALVGVGLSALGEKLKESYPTVGGFIETVGDLSTIIGTWSAILVPIVTTLFPGLVASVQAYILANGGLLGAMKVFTSGIYSTLSSYIAAHGGVGLALRAFGKTMWTTAGGLLTALKTAVLPALAALKAAMLPLLIPIAKFVLIIGAVVAAGWLLWEGLKLVGKGLMWLWDTVKSVGTMIGNGLSSLWEIITKPFTMLWDWFKNSFIGKMLGLSDKAEDKKSSKSVQDLAQDEARKFGRSSPNTQDKQAAAMMYRKQAMGGRSEGTLSGVSTLPGGVPADQTVIGGGKEIIQSQTAAVDAADRKSIEEKNNNQKMVGLLEDIKGANEASVGVQAKGVAVADSSNRYLRNQSMYSGQ